MTTPPPLPVTVQSANPLGPKPPSRVLWFVLGFVTASAGALILILIAAVAGLVEERSRATQPSQQATQQTENQLYEQTVNNANQVAVGGPATSAAQIAKLVAHPLRPEGEPRPNFSNSDRLAAMWSRVESARQIRNGGGEIGNIAGEFANTMESLSAVVAEPPSMQPLVRAGLDSFGGRMANDDQAFLLGLLGIGSEISKLGEVSQRVSTLHTRLVACRLRVADVAIQNARPQSADDSFAAVFSEVGVPGVEQDTLAIRNDSGRSLHNVMVLTELTGKKGERFTNLYYAEEWKPGVVMLAACNSKFPWLETVPQVSVVRYCVLADELTSRLFEISLNR